VGAGGTIRATSKGGSSWSGQRSGTSTTLYGASCPSTSTCFAVGQGGTIRATTNGGSSWSNAGSGTANDLYGVSCPSTTTCYAVGAAGTILATTNGGSSWATQTSGITSQLNGVSCPTANSCWAVGAGGALPATIDGGSSWPMQTSSTANDLDAVSCQVGSCWATGGGGTVVMTSAPGNTAAPSISGTDQEGQTLTASNGSWSGSSPISYGYQWRQCDPSGNNCSDIAGATNQSYTATAQDASGTLRVKVTAANMSGSSTATSAPTAVVGNYGYATGGYNGPVATGGNSNGGFGQLEAVATCYGVNEVPCNTSGDRNGNPCPAGYSCIGDLELSNSFATGSILFTVFRKNLLNANGTSGLMRLWIPWDSLSYSTSATSPQSCAPSPYAQRNFDSTWNTGDGGKAFRGLVWNIQAVEQLGLTPEVVVSGGSNYQLPEYPDPTYGDGTYRAANFTKAGLDYSCGVSGIVSSLNSPSGSGYVPPIRFEPSNEPNFYAEYNGALGGTQNPCGTVGPDGTYATNPCDGQYNPGGYLCGINYGPCGPLEAAELWETATAAADTAYGGASKDIARIAGLASGRAQSGWNLPYMQQIIGIHSGSIPVGSATNTAVPTYWAIHDYDDPSSASGTADLQYFENQLSSTVAGTRSPLYVWVTESAVFLNNGTTSDRNRAGCSSESDNNGTLGACVDNNSSAQQSGAGVWRSMVNVTASGVTTTQVYWYSFFAAGGGWDFGLVDQSGLHARPSFCTLTGYSTCDASSVFPAGSSISELGDYLDPSGL
jgi:hypothetical protein